MTDLSPQGYERWLLDQDRERLFRPRNAGCCPIASFLKEGCGLRGAGVFGTEWKPRAKSKRYPLPRWAVDHVVALDSDPEWTVYVPAWLALRLLREQNVSGHR